MTLILGISTRNEKKGPPLKCIAGAVWLAREVHDPGNSASKVVFRVSILQESHHVKDEPRNRAFGAQILQCGQAILPGGNGVLATLHSFIRDVPSIEAFL